MPRLSANIKRWKKFRKIDTRSNPVEGGAYVVKGMIALREMWRCEDMKKALEATQKEFESSSSRTPEYLAWHRLFKREFTKFLQSLGMTGIDFSKPNHFDLSGFFKDGGKDQIWYFSISDIRWSKDQMLIRTAKHYKDFTGGPNQYIPLTRGPYVFSENFKTILKWEAVCNKPRTNYSDATVSAGFGYHG